MRTQLATLLALSSFTAPLSETPVLRFDPAEGSGLSVEMSASRNLQGGELSVVMNGSEVPASFLPELSLDEEDQRQLVFQETYEAGADALSRRYETIRWTNVGQMEVSNPQGSESYPWDMDAQTSIEGRTLRFEREDDGTLAATAIDNETVEIPQGLLGGLSLRELLPDEMVGLDESWEVDGSDLAVLFSPGGDFDWQMPEEAAEHMLPEIRERSHEGELDVTLTSIEGGLAVCKLEGTLERITLQKGDLSQVPVADGTATDTVTETWTVRGEMRWNVEANHIHSISLEGDLHSETETERDPDQGSPTYSSTFTVEGTHAFELTTEALTDEVIEASSSRE